MRNLRLDPFVERDLRILAHIEESKRLDPDRDRRLIDHGSTFAHPDRCSIYDTPIPYILAQGGGISRFNPKRSWEVFQAGTANPSQSIAGAVTGWQTCPIPKNASMAWLMVGGAGSGGGAGLTGGTGVAKGGGGGGARGRTQSLQIPVRLLPSILWYWCALGGVGGTTSGATGGIGSVAFVTDSGGPQLGNVTSVFGDIILRSGALSATGGVGGTASGASAGGTGETASTSGFVFNMLGLWSAPITSADPGAAGGNATGPTAGGSLTWGGANGNMPFCGGAGGGAVDSGTNTPTAGGAINTNGLMQSVLGGATASGTVAGAGGDGQSIKLGRFQGFGSNGGGGGGAAVATGGVGGRGGNAGDFCSGGGGGGAGLTFGAGGNGGRSFFYAIFW